MGERSEQNRGRRGGGSETTSCIVSPSTIRGEMCLQPHWKNRLATTTRTPSCSRGDQETIKSTFTAHGGGERLKTIFCAFLTLENEQCKL